jgi:hypothetical protein
MISKPFSVLSQNADNVSKGFNSDASAPEGKSNLPFSPSQQICSPFKHRRSFPEVTFYHTFRKKVNPP